MPTPTIVVDANIVLSAVLGVQTRRALAIAGLKRSLVTSAVVAVEACSAAANLRSRAPKAERDIAELLAELDVRPPEHYGDLLEQAEITLRNAVASRNGSVRDAHVLALAWTCDADIWSHDRDFAGTGWRSWSSENLLRRLAGEPVAGQPVAGQPVAGQPVAGQPVAGDPLAG